MTTSILPTGMACKNSDALLSPRSSKLTGYQRGLHCISDRQHPGISRDPWPDLSELQGL